MNSTCVDAAPLVALEGRLRHCALVATIGVRPNFSDYSAEEQQLIRQAKTIYYPSTFYAELLDALGKRTFPSYHTYKIAQDKIKQTALFQLAEIPHPRTRVFFGKRHKRNILDYFDLPLVAKVARGSALGRGVFLIRSTGELEHYCQNHSPAYIQEYLPIERDIRVVVIGNKAVHAYWRVAPPGDFRTNVAGGGKVEFSPVPQEAISLAERAARLCRLDDVGFDICRQNGKFMVLEVNMKYGREGFKQSGIDYEKMMERLIVDGQI